MSNTNRKVNLNKGSSNTYVNKSLTYVKSLNSVLLVLLGLLMLLVVGLIVYWVYKAYTKSKKGDADNPILVAGSIDASDSTHSKSWVLPDSSGYNSANMAFTISFWIYIADWNYRLGELKALVVKSSDTGGYVNSTNAAPGLWLDKNKNNLIVQTAVLGTSTGETTQQVCDVANIPIQKWVHIAYVLDNRTVDVYVDCKLERSCILSGVPALNNEKLHLFPKTLVSGSNSSGEDTGFYGQLSSLRYFSSALKPVDIASICNTGPNATVGQSTKPHKPKPSPGGCPSKIYKDLYEIKDQLVAITDEVDDALEAQPIPDKHKETKWDITVESKTKPTPSVRHHHKDDDNDDDNDGNNSPSANYLSDSNYSSTNLDSESFM